LEWPVVFVPGCNDKLIPFGPPDRIEEERRLFYVAITRAKECLHLYAVKSRPISPFLNKAQYEHLMKAVQAAKTALGRSPDEWQTMDALYLAHCVRTLRLKRYFETWWHRRQDAETVGDISQAMQRLYAIAEQRGFSNDLGLRPEEAKLWELFGPLEREPEDADYSDLGEIVARRREAARSARKETSSQSPRFGSSREEVFNIGERVRHPKFGDGVIRKVIQDGGGTKITIQFDDRTTGQKQFLQQFAKLERLNR
jgi:DNA helicase-2/ATP-dependent DNA helicase PcrA